MADIIDIDAKRKSSEELVIDKLAGRVHTLKDENAALAARLTAAENARGEAERKASTAETARVEAEKKFNEAVKSEAAWHDRLKSLVGPLLLVAVAVICIGLLANHFLPSTTTDKTVVASTEAPAAVSPPAKLEDETPPPDPIPRPAPEPKDLSTPPSADAPTGERDVATGAGDEPQQVAYGYGRRGYSRRGHRVDTDPTVISRYMPADLVDDPVCRGKAPGTVYYTTVRAPNGRVGRARHVCGTRPDY